MLLLEIVNVSQARHALLSQEGSAARRVARGEVRQEPPLAWSRLRLDHAVLL